MDIDTTIREPGVWFIPTGITPNGHGFNDNWIVGNYNPDSPVKVMILDRWGKRLWKSDDYNNEWAGTDQNRNLLQNGTYYYILVYEEETFNGWINVMR